MPMALRVLKGPFTVDSYQRLAELGVLREDERVELIDGQVVEMSPIGDRHASCVRRLNRWAARNLLDVAIIDIQNTVELGEHDAPQPDVVVLKPRADAYPRHPQAPDVLLIIEIADTTVAYDRNVKVPLYARSGIPEAWLVDLQADRIEVYQEPGGGQYARVRMVTRGERLSPLRFPNLSVSVEEILGSAVDY